MNKYFSLVQEEKVANIDIYGDITSWAWDESDVSSYNLARVLDSLNDVDTINVYINSYGGEVAEGLAIFSSLKRHKAKIKTFCDGFACSIASVIFMAGDERIMSNASLLMIHNAWTYTHGNANQLRKSAEDLDKITSASINAYLAEINISKEELQTLLDNESWLEPSEAIEMGFATSIVSESKNDKPSQSIRKELVKQVKQMFKQQAAKDPEPKDPEPKDPEPKDPEPKDPEPKDPEPKDPQPQNNLLTFLNQISKGNK